MRNCATFAHLYWCRSHTQFCARLAARMSAKAKDNSMMLHKQHRGEKMGKWDISFTLPPIHRSKYTEIVLRQTRNPQIQVVNKGVIQHIEKKIRVFGAVHTICCTIL